VRGSVRKSKSRGETEKGLTLASRPVFIVGRSVRGSTMMIGMDIQGEIQRIRGKQHQDELCDAKRAEKLQGIPGQHRAASRQTVLWTLTASAEIAHAILSWNLTWMGPGSFADG